MKNGKNQDDGIRARLIKSASSIFAKKGYKETTVAEICEKAGANIAAVNYYFGNKEALYVESWRQSFQRSIEIYPPDGGVPADAPAEERLGGRILSIIKRFTDPESFEFEIMQKEIANPTGLLAEVTYKTIEPLRKALGLIVEELLGEKASKEQVTFCQMSIRAQCFSREIKQQSQASINRELKENLSVEAIAEHITQFSLAGIREIRRQIENSDKNTERCSLPISAVKSLHVSKIDSDKNPVV